MSSAHLAASILANSMLHPDDLFVTPIPLLQIIEIIYSVIAYLPHWNISFIKWEIVLISAVFPAPRAGSGITKWISLWTELAPSLFFIPLITISHSRNLLFLLASGLPFSLHSLSTFLIVLFYIFLWLFFPFLNNRCPLRFNTQPSSLLTSYPVGNLIHHSYSLINHHPRCSNFHICSCVLELSTELPLQFLTTCWLCYMEYLTGFLIQQF